MPKIHDQIMKELLSSFPDQFIRLAAPELAPRLDLSAIELEPTEYYGRKPTRRESRPDLYARIPRLDLPERSIVWHNEIELRFRKKEIARFWDYNRELDIGSRSRVHTIVLYLRGGPPGIEDRVYAVRSMGRLLTTFHYRAFGLSGAPSEKFLAQPEPVGWALAALMMPAEGRDKGELGVACLRRIFDAPGLDAEQKAKLAEVVLTYTQRDPKTAREIESLLAAERNKEVRVMITTWSEKMEARGEARGLAKGKVEGKTEGKLELALRLLAQRFGTLPDEVRHKLAAIESTDELAALVERVFRGDSLEDLGLA